MAWTDPNAKDFTVGQVLTSDEMDTYVLANTADLDDRLVGGLKAFHTLLTDDSVAATSTWEQWGTEAATAANPGRAVAVIAHLTGHVTGENTGRVVHECRLQISLDGGTTWNTGRENRGETDRTNANIQNVDQSVVHVHSGTPSGQVQVRAQIQQVLGTAGGSGWRQGQIAALMIPVGN